MKKKPVKALVIITIIIAALFVASVKSGTGVKPRSFYNPGLYQ